MTSKYKYLDLYIDVETGDGLLYLYTKDFPLDVEYGYYPDFIDNHDDNVSQVHVFYSKWLDDCLTYDAWELPRLMPATKLYTALYKQNIVDQLQASYPHLRKQLNQE